jgi:parallel beta-helix repeat protein
MKIIFGFVLISTQIVVYFDFSSELNLTYNIERLRDPIKSAVIQESIMIDGDLEFIQIASIQRWSGNGTINNPIILQNLNFSLTRSHEFGIKIINTRLFFRILNTTLISNQINIGFHFVNVSNGFIGDSKISSCPSYGIYLKNNSNIIIRNNSIMNSRVGISVAESEWINLEQNAIKNNGKGIEFVGSAYCSVNATFIFENRLGIVILNSEQNQIYDNRIENQTNIGIMLFNSSNNFIGTNTLTNNIYFGIYFDDSPQNSLIANQFIRNGIYIKGTELMKVHFLNASGNIVNNLPLHIIQHQKNYIISNPTGQIILINCSNSEIKNQNFIRGSSGIIMLFSFNTSIENSTFKFNIYAISLQYSYNISISRIMITNSVEGIRMQKVENTQIRNITIRFTMDRALFLIDSHNNSIIDNMQANSKIGYEFITSQQNKVIENQFWNNSNYTISLDITSANNQIIYNNFLGPNLTTSHAYSDQASNNFSYNYWANHTEPDENEDGIVDNSYLIDGETILHDYLPFVKPNPHKAPSYSQIKLTSPQKSYNGTVTLEWTPIFRAEYYLLFRTSMIITEITNLPIHANLTVTEYQETISTNGTYYYYIIAGNSWGLSPLSNRESVIVILFPPVPETPILEKIQSNNTKKGKIYLNWTVCNFTDHYQIYRSNETINDISGLTPIVSTSNNFYQDTIDAIGIYYYAILAVNQYNYSQISNCESINITVLQKNEKIVQSLQTIGFILVPSCIVSYGIILKRKKVHSKLSSIFDKI